MKRFIMIFVIMFFAACGNKEEEKLEINLVGELPARGEVRVELYGYDTMLADHSATLIVIHREELEPGRTVKIGMPEDAVELIDPPVSSSENASFYIRVEIKGEEGRFTQDFDRNPFIEVSRGSRTDVFMRREKKD